MTAAAHPCTCCAAATASRGRLQIPLAAARLPQALGAGRWSVGARRRDVLADMKLVALGSA